MDEETEQEFKETSKKTFKGLKKIFKILFSLIGTKILFIIILIAIIVGVFNGIISYFNPFHLIKNVWTAIKGAFSDITGASQDRWDDALRSLGIDPTTGRFLDEDSNSASASSSTYAQCCEVLSQNLHTYDGTDKKTNLGLAQFAKNAVTAHCGYVWSWHGKEINEINMKAWQKSSVAQSEEACSTDADIAVTLKGWNNHPGFDCSGLIIGYMCFDPVSYTVSSTKYSLTDSERQLIEQTVANEAEGEPYQGQMAVAQCMLDTCLASGEKPAQVVVKGQYAVDGHQKITDSVKKAVSAVFDEGKRAVDAPIRYFYQPELCKSGWHESLKYITTIGHHKFFASKDYDYGFTNMTHGYGYLTSESLYSKCVAGGKKNSDNSWGNGATYGTLSASQKSLTSSVPVGAAVLRHGHVAVYVGNDSQGAVIVEAAGYNKGVVTSHGLNSSRSSGDKFSWWIKLPAVTYNK